MVVAPHETEACYCGTGTVGSGKTMANVLKVHKSNFINPNPDM